MRITSPGFTSAVNAQESDKVLLPLLSLSHATWPDPLRFVRDLNSLVHQGQTYLPAAFDLVLPDDIEEGTPVMQLSIDNVDQRIVKILRSASGKIGVDVRYVLADTPDFIEVGPFDMEMPQVEYNAETITAALIVEPILEEQAGYMMMTPATTPGLF